MIKSAEDKMKQAALRVFVQKGFSNCSSREIAKEAGMNVALVNYYFRSKSKLFAIIFETVMQEFLQSMVQVFVENMPLKDKIRLIIEKEYEFLSKHPEIPLFILNELSRNPDVINGIKPILEKVVESGVFQEAEALQNQGLMRKMDFMGISLLIMSNCQYPFMAKPLMKVIHQADEAQYMDFLKDHQKLASELVVSFLFPTDLPIEP